MDDNLTPTPPQEEEKHKEIEEAWAEALQMEYDAEEAHRRAEEVAVPPTPPLPPTPPVVPESPTPPAPQKPEPYNPAQGYSENFAPRYGHPEPMPPTFLVWSVLAIVFCSTIPGIVALVYSSMVSSKYYAKDYEGARRCSRMAEIWIIASIVLGIVVAALYIPIMLLL